MKIEKAKGGFAKNKRGIGGKGWSGNEKKVTWGGLMGNKTLNKESGERERILSGCLSLALYLEDL